MYIPVLNASRAELNGIIDSLPELIRNGKIVPLFIPTRESGINTLQRSIVGAGLSAYVMANPHHGPYHHAPIPSTVATALFGHANIIPTFQVSGRSASAAITAFARRHRRHAYFLHEAISPAAEAAIAASAPEMVFIRRRTGGPLRHGKPIPGLARNVHCEVGDYFIRQASSAHYPADNVFTDRRLTIGADPDYAHFGDFSVIGDHFSEGGSQPFAIAVHYAYCNGNSLTAPLHVAHYVSRRNRAIRGDTAGKVQEACSYLVADAPRLAALEHLNSTAALAAFRHYSDPVNRTNAEMMKRIAVRQHMLLMSAIF